MTSFTLAAPAKLNLYLHVTAKRPDGYHELDSLVAFADVNDHLTFDASETLNISFSGEFSDGIEDVTATSVHKAATWLASHAGVLASGTVSVEKNLPVAAGLGGGSADCAAALKGFARLWGLDVHWGEHAKDIAFALGADVPVCLAAEPVHMAGIGEEISAAPDLPSAWVLLVNAREPVSTAKVYGGLNGRFHADRRIPSDTSITTASELAELLTARTNSLADPAIETAPVVAVVLEEIQANSDCLLARVSGSGGTCFGLYQDQSRAETAAQKIRNLHPDWWVAAGALL